MRILTHAGAALAAATLLIAGAAAADTLRLGFITATSGPLKGPAEPAIAAVELAVEEINAAGGVNGKQLEVFTFDSGSDPKQASLGVRKLSQDDKVLAILGPFSSGEVAVAFNVGEREELVLLSNASSAPGLTDGKDWAWRITEDEGKQFARLMKTLEKLDVPRESAEIIYVSDERVANVVGTKLYPALMGKFGIAHGEPVAVTYDSFDISTQVAPIVARAPDIVAVAGLPENAAKIIRELNRQGFEGRVIGSQIFADPNILDLFGGLGEGTTFMAGFHASTSPEAASFQERFIERNAERGIRKLGAHHSDAQTYDGIHLLAKVMAEAGVTGDPAKLAEERLAIREGLKRVQFAGVLGDNLCFVGGDAELPGYVIQIKDGQWTLIDSHPADPC